MFAERSFEAMGTAVHLVVDGPAELLDAAEHSIHRCEARWSRFRPTSELRQLNASAGHPTVVSNETFSLVQSAIEAWRRTDGLFDPTVLPALEALGYDRSFETMTPDGSGDHHLPTGPPSVVPGPAEIGMHPAASMIELPADLRLDLGGLAKGATADLVVDELRHAGALACCVNIGGDLRVWGSGPHQGVWEVAFKTDIDGHRLRLAAGAVCTSSTSQRRWIRNGVTLHHLIDPSSGRPMESDVTTSTVIARTALAAEVLAKLPLGWGAAKGAEFLRRQNTTGRLEMKDGSRQDLAGFDRFLSWSETNRVVVPS